MRSVKKDMTECMIQSTRSMLNDCIQYYEVFYLTECEIKHRLWSTVSEQCHRQIWTEIFRRNRSENIQPTI